MTTVPATMRAWVAARAGQPKDVLSLKTDWPTPPPPKAGEIIVKVSLVALNPGDIHMIAMRIPFKKNTIAGMDFLGEVVQVGPSSSKSTSNLRVGMVVGGTITMDKIWHGGGVLADYALLCEDAVVQKPEGMEDPAASALLGIVGQTTAVLLQRAKLIKGDRVLVNGASGGVGCVLVQILHAMGVHVTGVCSARNESLVRGLGADDVVDYTAHASLYDHLSSRENGPFDAIMDLVGDDTLFRRSPGYLKPKGKFFSIHGGPFGFLSWNYLPVVLGGTPRAYHDVFSKPCGASAQQVVDWYHKGWVKDIPIDSTFGMSDVLQAFEKLATKRTVGKIIIRMD